ncbi:MAG: hypothetical protein AB7F50_11325 [Fimbriimonadaceae bacterium]
MPAHLGVRPAGLEGASVSVGTTWVVTFEHQGRTRTTGLGGGQADAAVLGPVIAEPKSDTKGAPPADSRPGYPAPSTVFTVAENTTAVARRARAISLYLAEVEEDAAASYEAFETASKAIEGGSALRPPLAGSGFGDLDMHFQRSLLESQSQQYRHHSFGTQEESANWLSSAKITSVTRNVSIRVKVQMPDGTFQGFQTTILP